MSLLVHDTLSLNTQIGVCKIQLCIGDITKLPKEEEVDVLVVSAFPGDYSPTPSSLIGALAFNLGISVRNLSKDKEEDLRKQYFCWWSKPLPEHLSFRRLLCFEGGFGSRGTRPPQVVGAVFRCLVPILSGKDIAEGSVIMPLLASGDQGYSKTLMLRLLMHSAIQWIKAGLQLRTLKIVLFSRDPEKHDKSFEPLFDLFQEMSAKFGEQDLSYERKLVFDVYISHSPKDHDYALIVANFLKSERNLSVYYDFQELNTDESWQEEIFNIMAKCARVVALLSPGYLQTESCIEQYNMALCINRRSRETVLAPFYVTSLDYMPTYMSVIQYEDCRPGDKERLKSASVGVAESLRSLPTEASDGSSETTAKLDQSYDVFISYSHCNKEHTNKLVEMLQMRDASLNVFIDTEGLNTGTSWQQILYSALDKSKSTIALLSPDYINSKVCYEEFCLSYALHVDRNSTLELVSLLVEPVDELPKWCEMPLPVDLVSPEVDYDHAMAKVCNDLVNSLRGTSSTPEEHIAYRLKNLKSQDLTMESAMDNYRKTCFLLRSNILTSAVNIGRSMDTWRPGHTSDVFMSIDGHHVGTELESSQGTLQMSSGGAATPLQVTSAGTLPSQVTSSSSAVCDVALSFAEEDRKSAVIMKQLILEKMPSLNISEPMFGDVSRVQLLDIARLIVPLLSPAFLASTELMEELNIALFRNRASSSRVLFPVHVSALPLKPSYVHLIPCEVSPSNYRWASMVVDKDLKDDVMRMSHHHDIDVDVVFGLKLAADQISERLNSGSAEVADVNRVLLSVLVVEENWKAVQNALQEEPGLEKWKRAFGVERQTDLIEKKATQDNIKIAPGVTNDHTCPTAKMTVTFEDDFTENTEDCVGKWTNLLRYSPESDSDSSGPAATLQKDAQSHQLERSTQHDPLRPSSEQDQPPMTSHGYHCRKEEQPNVLGKNTSASKSCKIF